MKERHLSFALALFASLPFLAYADETRTEPKSNQTSSSLHADGGMKYLLTFALRGGKDSRNEAITRFKKTKGEPPKGVKLLGRVTRLDFSKVFVLVETQDAAALAQYALEWSDVFEVHTMPVMDDVRLMEVLERVSQ
jgi:hypothetical protein